MSYAATSVILITIVLLGYPFFQKFRGSAKEQQQIHTIENHPDPTMIRRSDSSKASAPKKTESAPADRMSPPNASHPAKNPVGPDLNKSMGLQQDTVRNQVVEIYFNAAKKFSRHRRWQSASDYYQIVSKLNPDYPLLNKELAMLELEIKNQKTYQQDLAQGVMNRSSKC